MLWVAVDVGGTFTDAVLFDDKTGDVHISKVSSTSDNPVVGFLESINQFGLKDKIQAIFHGTTIATNALIEGKGAKVGLITTKGFKDVLEIGTQLRPSLYSLIQKKPKPLIPRRLRMELDERTNAKGKIEKKINVNELKRIIRFFFQEGVESIAVSLLFSFVNPKNEITVRNFINKVKPNMLVSLSSEVCPQIGEYYRTSTTAVNSYLMPLVSNYLTNLKNELNGTINKQKIYIMSSNGGTLTLNTASRLPVLMIESGPAAGVVAACGIAKTVKIPNVISFDMGGTTAKACLIQNYQPNTVDGFEVGGEMQHSKTFYSGGSLTLGVSGYPVMVPTLDLAEVGTGGGSIAYVDMGGVIRVGPKSAGANPGPACYGKGGEEPTVTDANVVLGRLNRETFLGGTMKIYYELAKKAVTQKIAKPLGLSVIEASYGILKIAVANMVNAIRLVSVQRGYNPKEYTLIAFGGAGPTHAVRIAKELGIKKVLIPLFPGVTSALGLLLTDIVREYVLTKLLEVKTPVALSEINQLFNILKKRASNDIKGAGTLSIIYEYAFDIRYTGQNYYITVWLGECSEITKEKMEEAFNKFHDEHKRIYGHSSPGEELQIVNLRLKATGIIPKPNLKSLAPKKVENKKEKSRIVYGVSENIEEIEVPVYWRHGLSVGETIEGPAIIEQYDSTTILEEKSKALVDEYGNLIIEVI
jgi:N-methylhydantoinase A